MKKQTAIEWLEMEIVRLEALYPIPNAIYQLCEMAKENGKQQMGDAYYDGKNNGMDICNPLSRAKGISFEQYYNETYEK